jgi:hypothetical protein
LCGVFGNIPDHDVHRTIDALPQFWKGDATVIASRQSGFVRKPNGSSGSIYRSLDRSPVYS